jgi:hypothetical protein
MLRFIFITYFYGDELKDDEKVGHEGDMGRERKECSTLVEKSETEIISKVLA